MFEGIVKLSANDNHPIEKEEVQKYNEYLNLLESAPEAAKAIVESLAHLPRRERVLEIRKKLEELAEDNKNRVLVELLSQVSTIETDLDNLERHSEQYPRAYDLVQKMAA